MLVVLGVLIALPAWFRGGPRADIRGKSLLLVTAAIVLFGLALRPLGIVLATFATAFVASLADEDIGWVGRIAMSAGVAAITALIFVVGLGMVLPLWPFSR